MPTRSNNIGGVNIEVDVHPLPMKPDCNVASIRGLDVTEPCDGYTAAELRSIARYLENIADGLEYTNSTTSIPLLFNTVS